MTWKRDRDLMRDSWNLAEGDPISDRLIAVSLLGGGSAYEAYLAFDRHLFAPVVVKVVRPDQVADASTLAGLERETALVGDLAHPAIVRGYHAVLGGERPHLVLENLDGPRLSSLVRRHGPMPPQQVLPLGLELASALHYLRERDIVHLDVKPANIIMGAPPRLIDLSVARPSADAAALNTPIGTDAWMAPEQCDPPASGVPGFASDVWGLGASLFYAVAGYRPFPRETDENLQATDGRSGHPDPGHPDSVRPETGRSLERWPQLFMSPAPLPANAAPGLVKVIESCLAFDPADRPTPAEVADMLEPMLAALPRPRLAGFKVSIR
jgi:serine/threonine-protein kinase